VPEGVRPDEVQVKNTYVKDLMVPLEDYVTIDEDASLREAVIALEKAHERMSKLQYKHRAILVLNKAGKVVGKLSMHDVIVALEPAYRQLGDYKMLVQAGVSSDLIRSIQESFAMWQHPLENICQKAGQQRVGDVMYAPREQEHVEEDASLDEAVHQLVVGSHQSLLVTRGPEKKVVGVLRLTDVFQEICKALKDCK
jgi:predicted transcriptional regulator